ncbi:MAG: PEP-CTERM sorting domain-containing protein [Terriglobia bacterium]
MKPFHFLCIMVLAVAVPLMADSVSADGSYHEFLFGNVGSFAVSCAGGCLATTNPVAEETSTPPWTFTGPGTIFALDLFQPGDEFAVYDNSILLGDTSAPDPTAVDTCSGNIACAMADSGYSQGSFSVGGGSHSITIEVTQSNQGGAAVFSVSGNAVPEPASAALLLIGLGGITAWACRRSRQRDKLNAAAE